MSGGVNLVGTIVVTSSLTEAVPLLRTKFRYMLQGM